MNDLVIPQQSQNSQSPSDLAVRPEQSGGMFEKSNDPREMLIPRSISEVGVLAKIFSGSGMYAAEGKALSVDQVAVIILTGIDLGLTPSQALRGIKVIKGQPAPSADTLVACVKRRKDVCEYIEVVSSTSVLVQMAGKRVGDVHPTVVSFSIEDAKQAGLTGSPMYAKYPEQMIYARCAVKLIRRVWPDIALGLYTEDELKGGAKNAQEADMAPRVQPLRSIAFDTAAQEFTPAEQSECKEISARIIKYLDSVDDEKRNYTLGYMDYREWSGNIQDLPLDVLREYDEWISGQVAAEAKADEGPTPSNDPPATSMSKDDEKAIRESSERGRLVRELNGRLGKLTAEDKSLFKTFAAKAFGGVFRPVDMTAEQLMRSNKALDDLADDPFVDLVKTIEPSGEGHGKS